jgi:hypothetical protein
VDGVNASAVDRDIFNRHLEPNRTAAIIFLYTSPTRLSWRFIWIKLDQLDRVGPPFRQPWLRIDDRCFTLSNRSASLQ